MAYDRAKLNDDYAQLITPIGGTILKLARDSEGIPIADGQLVSGGLLVAQVAPLEELDVYVDLIGPDLSRVEIGQQVRVLHSAFPDLKFDAEVVRLSPTVNPQTHTFRAVIGLTNVDFVLRPGMFVQVEIITEQRLDVPVVSYESITQRQGEPVVFVADGQVAKRRAVTLGLADDDYQEVIEGLQPGDPVIVKNLETLQHGSKIRY